MWTQADAIELCKVVEAVCPPYGCHVALTGGLLYKGGERKDADLLFYRIRQTQKIDDVGLFTALELVGLKKLNDFGFCVKADYKGKPLDIFFPESTLKNSYDPKRIIPANSANTY